MPDLLLFRPPRRQPRLLVVNVDEQHLALLTLDPWELRYAAKHEWSRTNRHLRAQAMLNVAMIRERPHSTLAMTLRYTHLSPQAKQEAVQVLNSHRTYIARAETKLATA